MSGCSESVIRRLTKVLGDPEEALDCLRTRIFIVKLRRLLRKQGFTKEQIDRVVEFAFRVRHWEAYA